jgi:hypothetical protein
MTLLPGDCTLSMPRGQGRRSSGPFAPRQTTFARDEHAELCNDSAEQATPRDSGARERKSGSGGKKAGEKSPHQREPSLWCILAADPYSDRRDPSQTRNLGTPHRCSKVMGPCSLGNEIHCMGSAVGTSGSILVTTVLGNGIDRDEWLSTVEAVYENAPGTGRAHSCSYGANSSRESGFLHKNRCGPAHRILAWRVFL